MFDCDEMRMRDSKLVIGPVSGDIVKVSIGECSMEDIKGAVSSME